MTRSGLPDHLAVAVTELPEALMFEEEALTTQVQGSDVDLAVSFQLSLC